MNYSVDCALEVGSYVQVHEEPDPSNTIDVNRTTGALERTSNLQGGYYFLSLDTGKVLNRRKWTLLPMTNDVINRVNALADKEDHDFIFWNRNGTPDDDSVLTGVDNGDNDSDSDYSDEESQEHEDNGILIQENNKNNEDSVNSDDADSEYESDDEIEVINNNNIANNEVVSINNDDDTVAELQNDLNDAIDEFEHLYDDNNENDSESEYETENEDNNSVHEHQNQDNNNNNVEVKTRSGRTIKKVGYLDYEPGFGSKKYASSNANIGIEHSDEELMGMIFSQMFLQYNLHEGLKKFGNVGRDAAIGELKQMHL